MKMILRIIVINITKQLLCKTLEYLNKCIQGKKYFKKIE